MLIRLHFFISFDVMLEYCVKKSTSQCTKKCIYINWLGWFLIFMKFVISTKHCDFIWLE